MVIMMLISANVQWLHSRQLKVHLIFVSCGTLLTSGQEFRNSQICVTVFSGLNFPMHDIAG